MPLTHREKERFFHSLSRLVRSGATLPKALDKLAGPADRRLRGVMEAMRKDFAAGQTASEVFQAHESDLGAMEASVLGAAERTGRIDQVLRQLGDYHASLASSREKAVAKLNYPVFLFHFGILILSVPRLLTSPDGSPHGLGPYLRATLGMFAVVYIAVIALFQIAFLLPKMAVRSAFVDRVLGWLPLLGSVRRNFALSRFCMTYELHLGAGVNTFDALTTAADASQSGVIRGAIARALPEIRHGAQVGETLAGESALPPTLIEGLIVGEESGSLDRVLMRLTEGYREEAAIAVDLLAEWIPRMIYLMVAGFMAWKIVNAFMVYYIGPLQKAIEG